MSENKKHIIQFADGSFLRDTWTLSHTSKIKGIAVSKFYGNALIFDSYEQANMEGKFIPGEFEIKEHTKSIPYYESYTHA